MSKRTKSYCVILAIGCAGCQNGDSPAEPIPIALDRESARPPQVVTWDDRLAAFDVDGFAGLYQDSAGELVVQTTDLGIDRIRVSDRISELKAHTGANLGVGFRVEAADYAFADLQRWRVSMRQLLSHPDVNSLRIDDEANRISLGLAPNASVAALATLVGELGVPVEAVVFSDVEPIHFDTTLREKVRDTVGGLEIANEAGQVCSLGFNAVWGAHRVFVTASHCTNGMGGVQGDKYFQPEDTVSASGPMTRGPWVPPGYDVGVEQHDPIWTMNCGGEYFCRYSDSAIVDYYTGVGSDLGEIARTAGIGSITISTSSPRWYIVGEEAMLTNQLANRVGRTTGHRAGLVKDTCDDVIIDEYVILCSVKYGVGSQGGDSGAPVFRIVGSQDVKLAGIHFASTSSDSWYSPIAQIRQELETALYPLTTY